jgi:type I restriction enzyme S subunit
MNSKQHPSWEHVSLSKIAEINPSFDRTIYSDDTEVSFVPMKRVSELTGMVDLTETRKFVEVRKGFTPFRDDDIIFAKITPCMENGKIAVLSGLRNGVGFGSTEFHVIRLPKGLPRKYFFFYLVQEGFRKDAERNMTGSVGQRRVPTDYLKDTIIPIPPLPEQHRIVNKIEELFTQLDAGVELLQKTKVLLNQYRQSVLKAAFEGKLTEEWRERNRGKIKTADSLIKRILSERGVHSPCPIDTSALKKLPEGWSWVRISDIADKIQYGYTALSTSEPVGPRFLRITDIQNNRVDWDSVPFCKISDEKKPDLLLEEGDIVFARTGATVGKSFLIKGEIPESVFASYLIRIKLSKQFNPNFLYHFFQSSFYWNQIIEKQAGIGQPNVNGTKLSGLILPSPGPEEQTAIVQKIEASFSIADAIESTLLLSTDQASALRSSILRTAFQGKLVSQDPADEPASKLLERLKAERSTETPRGRKPRQAKLF